LASTETTGAPAPACSVDLGGEIAELGVAVFVLGAFDDFGVALQAEPQIAQHPSDRAVGDRMPDLGQRGGQVAGRFGRPHQQRHRIPAGHRIHQRLQLCRQLRVGLGQLLATSSGRAHPDLPFRLTPQLTDPAGHGVRVHPGRARDRLDPASAQLGRFRPEQQAPLPFIQVRTQHCVLACRGLRHLHSLGHSTNLAASDLKT
jgi:hypothetical protein